MALERDRVVAAIAELRGLPRDPFGDRSTPELLGLLDELGQLRRLVESTVAMVAAELDAGDRLEVTQRTTDLVAARVGVTAHEARVWCAVGRELAPRMSLHGEVLPPRWEHLSRALLDGGLPVGKANAAVAGLESVVHLLDPGEAQELEAELLGWAGSLSDRDFGRLCRSLPDRVDPDGVEFREQRLRDRAGLVIGRTVDGMSRWVLTLDPESEGILRTALDARTAPRRAPRFDDGAQLGVEDTRSLPQRRLQAITDLARDSVRHDHGQLAGSAVTMVVTVTEEALRTGIGAATIAGVDTPISAGTARRMAADAHIIPAVLGGQSEVLDLGRGRRCYSPAQRTALGLRDGGCIWAGCPAPPGWCEIAHLKPWAAGGLTDLNNAALMCPYHHRRFDIEGWNLITRPDGRYLIPPAHVDANRTPLRAGPLPRAA